MKRLCIAEVTAARKASLCPVGSSVVESSVHDTHRPNPADEMTRRVAYNVIHTLVSRNKGNERAATRSTVGTFCCFSCDASV